MMARPLENPAPALTTSGEMLTRFHAGFDAVPAGDCVIERPAVSEPAAGAIVRLLTATGGVARDQLSAEVPSVIGFVVVSLNRPLALAVPLATATIIP